MLVPPGDAAALADGLRWLAALPEDTRRAMGGAGRAHVQARFTLEAQAAGLAAAIDGLGR
jgi:glycosyltransferase involved in cell wall biosynthesis